MWVDPVGTEKMRQIMPNWNKFYVNKSSFTLANSVNGLINNKKNYYISWRDSKLARLLKESLSGGTKIVVLANIIHNLMVIEDTFNNLNFAKK